MKCKNCGGEMDSQAIRCPYCNSENKEGILFQQQVQKKLERYKLLKPFILKKKTPEMVSKYMTRLLFILAGVILFLLLASFLIWMLGARMVKSVSPAYDSYAGWFDDFETGSFFTEMNVCVEKMQNHELPSEYEIEQLIQYGFKTLKQAEGYEDERAKEQTKLITVFLTEYLGLEEEEMEYLYDQPHDQCRLNEDWLTETAKRVRKRLEEMVES